MFRQVDLPTLTLAGSLGAAAGTTTSTAPVCGELLAVRLQHTGSTATMTTTVSTVAGAMTLLSVGAGSSGWWFPRAQLCTNGGTALAYDAAGSAQVATMPIVDYVKAVVANGGTAGNTLAVSLLINT